MGMLEGKTILVTGGSTGIGRATCQVLGAEGARVVIADLQDEEGEETVKLVDTAGGRAEYHHVDVGNETEVEALVAGIATSHGSLDGAFNNAGVEGPALKIPDYPTEEWERVTRVNMTGVYICMKYELAQMAKQGSGGSIVSTSSVAGLRGIPGSAGYNASKHAVIGLTRTVALEYASRNIRANAVCPGFIDTPMLNRVTDNSDKMRKQMQSMVPMRRVAEPSEIGDAVAWLLSDRSSYVTGVALPVDGGWTAQ